MSAAAVRGQLACYLRYIMMRNLVHADVMMVLQDDTYTESYISTIGVDFVSDLRFELQHPFCILCSKG